ncbi:adenylyl-sulfate kinase [Belnapia sp. T18]|uniref:Adenylyl-sulfate kinase n=1 Tax=Belnapia arida TaxID=2804533 RepID=A0ABS1U7D1_9PROT|nr:adenylyl-sulfate kinase [Belnapia arida]MBL6079854.1 adenylyl-sulfate kinase [Belnapia arida]
MAFDAATPNTRETLRFLACGSVDDGKSSLIGRLLWETGQVMDDTRATLARDSRRFGTTGEAPDLALLLDGLEAERAQGITIDVAYRSFATARRSFLVADTPGHEQYTRNMATGASGCDAAVLLADARRGLLVQTRRHATICALLGIRDLVLAVNKMDLVGFDEAAFHSIAAEFAALATSLGFRSASAVPISARHGDNVTTASAAMPWHDGPPLLTLLEDLPLQRPELAAAPRLPVQWVNRASPDFRGLCGTVAAGIWRRGDAITVATTGATSRIARILGPDGEREQAEAGEAVTLLLAEEIDAAHGDLLAPPDQRPTVASQFAADLVWFDAEPLLPGRDYLLRAGTAWTPCTVTRIRHRLDIATGTTEPADSAAMNEVVLANLSTLQPLAFDPYAECRPTGGLILVDRTSNRTVGAGMIRHALRRAANIHRQAGLVTPAARAALLGQSPRVVWFTGLSGSGKSTIARLVEQRLHAAGRATMLLDGDNLRHGLNRDLGFTEADRVENIRRAGEAAKLLAEAGLIAICAFISPFRADRRMVRDLLPPGSFLEIFVDASLADCIRRDPKGLYAKALAGEIPNFTGIGSVYEPPEAPELILRSTPGTTPEALADAVLARLAAP